jgi:hypothetical protein
VDVAIVSACDFSSVVDLTVLAALLDCPQHLPVHLELNLGSSVRAPNAPKLKIFRPQGDQALAYAGSLASLGGLNALRSISETLWAENAGSAVQQLTQLIQRCAGRSRRPRPSASGVSSGGAPWWDEDLSRARDSFFSVFNSGDGAESVTAARGVYRRLKNHKKLKYYQQQQLALIDQYFSANARDFWRAFQGGPRPACPLDDMQAWSAHFDTILNGGPAEREPLSPEHILLKESLTRGAATPDLSGLNTPFTEEEVQAAIVSLPSNKAADAFGLTAECLKHASTVEAEGRHYTLVPVLTSLYNHIFTHPAQYPHQFRVNTLTPIFKGKGSDRDMNCYRGIAVGSILGKVFERILYTRANAAAEAHSLRAPTQFGFRKGHGTLDGLFVLRHLIDQARHNKHPLFCLFVDFEKAFDTVPRPEMIGRCRKLGMNGAFLDAVMAMYENILMAVKSQGQLGPTFATTQGTKQGGELSPLLFGLFIEQVHELLKLKCPGMGPVVGDMRVPDVLYADDVACLSTDPVQIQEALDVLLLFCKLFGMRVNTAKTHVVIFRERKLPVAIEQYVWHYAGDPVSVKSDFKYLGATFHCTKGLVAAASSLATAGRRAMHALLTRLKAARISQSAFQVRLFNVLVEPVLSYGCQVWGPDMVGGSLHLNALLDNRQESVQIDFLRIISGLPKAVKRPVLLREFGARPLHLHWLKLCARFWQRTLALPPSRLLRMALIDNIQLCASGCQDCWTAKFLSVMRQIGVLESTAVLTSVDSFSRLPIDEVTVAAKAELFLNSIWAGLPSDPSTALSNKVVLATYHHWVCGGSDLVGAPHLHSFLTREHKTCLARLRVGSLDLRVHTGRFTGTARHLRVCRACATGQVEDLPHFFIHCPAHAAARIKYESIFADRAHPHLIFAHPDQRSLACCLSEMLAARPA